MLTDSDEQRLTSKDRCAEIHEKRLIASEILHLRIGLLKPFLVGAKKTRMGPVMRVGALIIGWC